jgi:hypothetical protein
MVSIGAYIERGTYNKCTEFIPFPRVTTGCTVFHTCQLGLGLNEITSGKKVFFCLRFKGNKVRQNALVDVQLQTIVSLSTKKS